MFVNLPDILSAGSVGTWVRTALLKNAPSAVLPPMLFMKSVDMNFLAYLFNFSKISVLSNS